MASKQMWWRDPALGEPREVQAGGATVRAFDTGPAGDGDPALVFVNGVIVNPNLWRHVVPRLSDSRRCVSIELPLGGHEIPAPDGDLSTPGLGRMLGEAIDALGLERPVLVGNDSGGAICQIALGQRPELASGLVLTSCDAFETFPPTLFRVLFAPARFAVLTRILFQPLRLRRLRGLPIAFGWLARTELDARTSDSFILPLLTTRHAARDFARILRGLDRSVLVEAGRRLAAFEGPAVIAWSREDRFFPPSDAERLAEAIPRARIEWIDDSYTFSPIDRPDAVAGAIEGLCSELAAGRREPAGGRAG